MLKNKKYVVCLFLLCLYGIAIGRPVSIWNFDSLGLPDSTHNNEISVPDILNANNGWLNGVAGTTGAYEGSGFMVASGASNGFYTSSLNGFSKKAGTFMFAFRSNGSSREYATIISTHLYKSTGLSSSPIKVVLYHPTAHLISIVGGIACEEPTIDYVGLADGNWHTCALTYKDGDIVRFYVDGQVLLGTNLTYNAAEYSSRSVFYLGSGNGSDCFPGSYDYLAYFDRQLSDQEVVWYSQHGYLAISETCGGPGTNYLVGDVNFDCDINLIDFAMFANSWFYCNNTGISCGGKAIDVSKITTIWNRNYYMSESQAKLFIDTDVTLTTAMKFNCRLFNKSTGLLLQESIADIDRSGKGVAVFNTSILANGEYEVEILPYENAFFFGFKATKTLKKIASRSYAVQYNERGVLMRNGVRLFPFAIYYIQPYYSGLIFEYSNAGFNTHNLEWGTASSYISDAMIQAMYGVRPMVGIQNSNEIQSIPYNPNDEPGTLAAWQAAATQLVYNVGRNAGSNILAWYTWDEPPLGFWYDVTKMLNDVVHTQDPYHPTVMISNNPACFSNFAADATDILGVDPYPHLPIWRPMTMVSDWVDAGVHATKGTGKPVMAVLQTFYDPQGTVPPTGGRRMPTATELRCMTYLSIVHGATAIAYFSFDYNGRMDQYNPDTWSAVKGLAGEVRSLSGILTNDLPEQVSVITAAASGIDTKLFQDTDHYYLIAVNHENASVSGAKFFVAEIGGQVEVLFENRVIDTNYGGWIDDFGIYQTHIYKINK